MVEASYGAVIPEGFSPEQFFRVQFYTFKVVEDSEPEIKWFNSISCKEKYKDSFAEDLIKKDEFYNEDWMCPDIDDFQILYNTDFYARCGENFHMVINTCEKAAKIIEREGLTNKGASTDESVCYGHGSTSIT